MNEKITKEKLDALSMVLGVEQEKIKKDYGQFLEICDHSAESMKKLYKIIGQPSLKDETKMLVTYFALLLSMCPHLHYENFMYVVLKTLQSPDKTDLYKKYEELYRGNQNGFISKD